MRKQLVLTATALMMAGAAMAQDFKVVLQKTFTAFYTTWNQQGKVEYGNKLSLIARKYDKEWLANYYLAYAKVNLTYNEADGAKKDAYLDEAQTAIEDAVTLLGKDNDETHVMKAMIANARIGIDPKSRWQKYGKVFNDELDAAKEINANNPRIYTLRGISKFYTPKMFGGGKKAAKPYFEKAEGLFANITNDDITKPYWGKRANTYFLGQCNGEDKD